MRRNLLAYLEDIAAAISDIEYHSAGKSLSDYMADRTIRAAVEREFIIIGEAFAQMEKHFPGSRQRVQDVRNIVAFRNFLIHAYSEIDNAEVFAVVRTSLLTLKRQIALWICEIETASPRSIPNN